jgi:hypothetical protein
MNSYGVPLSRDSKMNCDMIFIWIWNGFLCGYGDFI